MYFHMHVNNNNKKKKNIAYTIQELIGVIASSQRYCNEMKDEFLKILLKKQNLEFEN